MMQIIQLR